MSPQHGIISGGCLVDMLYTTIDLDNPCCSKHGSACACMDDPWIAYSICRLHKIKGNEHGFRQSMTYAIWQAV